MGRQSGKQIQCLIDSPHLTEQEQFYYHAFWDLCARRVYSMTGQPGPILFGEIESYARLRGVRRADDLRDLVYFVLFLDYHWLQRLSERQESSKHGR